MKKNIMKYYLSMIFAAMLLGSIGIFVKLINHALPSFALTFLRMFFVTTFLFITIRFIDKDFMKVNRKSWLSNIMAGAIIAISFTLYIIGNVIGSVSNAVIILSTYPFFVLILGMFFLKEKINKDKIITLIGGFIGIIVLNPFQGQNNIANIIVLIAAIVYAGYIVLMRVENKQHNVGHVFWNFLFATIFLIPLAIWDIVKHPTSMSTNMLWVILLGVLSTGLAYLLYNVALRVLEAEIASSIAMIVMPLTAIILAIIFLSETISYRTILGGVILISSVVYMQQRLLFCKDCKIKSKL